MKDFRSSPVQMPFSCHIDLDMYDNLSPKKIYRKDKLRKNDT